MRKHGDCHVSDCDGAVSQAGVQMRRPRFDQIRESLGHVRQHDDGVRPHHLKEKTALRDTAHCMR